MSLLIMSIAIPLAAATADLHVTIEPPSKMNAGLPGFVRYTVVNDGPDTATNVKVTIRTSGVGVSDPPCYGGCRIGNLPPQTILSRTDMFTSPIANSVTVIVTVYSDANDPNSTDNTASRVFPLAILPDLTTLMSIASPYTPLKPSRTFPLVVTLYNNAPVAAHDVVVSIDGPEDAGVSSLPADCTGVAPGHITCHLAELPGTDVYGAGAAKLTKLTIQLIAPPRFEGGSATFTATARERETDFDETSNQASVTASIYRTFLVTSTADDGSGSLRQAIRDMDAGCATDPCLIGFHIEEPSPTPWKTIRITSPLPAVTAGNYFIDGSWQTETAGDTNSDGPEIEISGDGSFDGDGLTVGAGCRGEVAYLAINGFRGNGISVVDTLHPCQRNVNPDTELHHLFIGTDPTGSVAKPNGLRGVGTSFGLGSKPSFLPSLLIDNSVLSGNTRSGIFVGAGFVTIRENRIGLKAHSNGPLPNGASGIYFGPGTPHFTQTEAISSNDIAFNRDFGILPNRSGFASFSRNRIWANGNRAIDNTRPQTENGPLYPPVITRAQYDAASNKTVIEGSVAVPLSGSYIEPFVELFASDTSGTRGTGDAQRYIGSSALGSIPADSSPPEFPFRFVTAVDGDHTGDWVTATVTRVDVYFTSSPLSSTGFLTSGLSWPVQVTH